MLEKLFTAHIERLKAAIAGRNEERSDLDKSFNDVDRKNIASLRERRVPEYNDHIDGMTGDSSYQMEEFRDIVDYCASVGIRPEAESIAARLTYEAN